MDAAGALETPTKRQSEKRSHTVQQELVSDKQQTAASLQPAGMETLVACARTTGGR